ncbi:MAG TPA: hypothetical protein VJ842_09240 [Pyrinomonadaceae bacterium]|nr:hypothetical protein [Pyrinomonadaceae bacterium]
MTDKYYEDIKEVVKRRTSASLSNRPANRPRVEAYTARVIKTEEPVMFDEALLLAYLNSRPESKEIDDLVRQIEASRKRSQKTQKEIAKLRKRNQAMLAKL